jgi:AcrR family transcriptional regulator
MGIVERKEREKEKRRTDILDAAERIFFRQGVEKATMDDVAQEVELSKATLYLYFSSKEEIYFAIYRRGQDKLFNMIENATKTIRNTREQLSVYLSTIIKFQKKYPDYFEAFFYFLTRGVNLSEDSVYLKQHLETGRAFFNNWIRLVQRGQEEGLIRQNLNAIPVGAILWIQLIGFLKIYPVLIKGLKKQYDVSEENLIDDYFELILSGILKK